MVFRDWLARFDGGLTRTVSSREQYLMGKAWEAALDQVPKRWYGVRAEHRDVSCLPFEPLQYMTIDSIGMPDWTPDITKALACATREQVDTLLQDGDESYMPLQQ